MADTTHPNLREHGVVIEEPPARPTNAITDVKGVAIGHVGLSGGSVQTGCTARTPKSRQARKRAARAVGVCGSAQTARPTGCRDGPALVWRPTPLMI